MRIKEVKIENFRKLKSCMIEFHEEKTIFVGANNSGKTTAIEAIIKFLDRKKGDFHTNDFTLSNWVQLKQLGDDFLKGDLDAARFKKGLLILLPSMDIWLHVNDSEIHHVHHLLPSLDWEGGELGVTLRFEPKDIEKLLREFKSSTENAKAIVNSEVSKINLKLWPINFHDFLTLKLKEHFEIKSYTLIKYETANSEEGIPAAVELRRNPCKKFPLDGLIQINSINAQRGFADSNEKNTNKLSIQLKEYYDTHLDPTKRPTVSDVQALEAIKTAEKSFDEKLNENFKSAFSELQKLGYPGFKDPKVTISTKVSPIDGMDHQAAVQFEIMKEEGIGTSSLTLPENYNGLGYQNLISMIFKMIKYRSKWLQEGRAGKETELEDDEENIIEPLHLVIIEEPEAHLHPQVQQVFIRKAYEVLQNHKNLKGNEKYTTQLIVSTHSSHIAHEIPFKNLRYFSKKRRKGESNIPLSNVVNLSEAFGDDDITDKFISRYLRTMHCELLFADAAILVEGSVERMLIPHFIKGNFKSLDASYISLLEIGGSHAHRFKSLIEKIGLTTLIITDLDSIMPDGLKKVQPEKGKGLRTGNSTLKDWLPKKEKIDELLILTCDEKVYSSEDYSIRVAYQTPIPNIYGEKDVEYIPYTFEDAFAVENSALIKNMENSTGLMKKLQKAFQSSINTEELTRNLFASLENAKKAEFALDLLYYEKIDELVVPTYIREGLQWLTKQLEREEAELNLEIIVPSEEGGDENG